MSVQFSVRLSSAGEENVVGWRGLHGGEGKGAGCDGGGDWWMGAVEWRPVGISDGDAVDGWTEAGWERYVRTVGRSLEGPSRVVLSCRVSYLCMYQ